MTREKENSKGRVCEENFPMSVVEQKPHRGVWVEELKEGKTRGKYWCGNAPEGTHGKKGNLEMQRH